MMFHQQNVLGALLMSIAFIFHTQHAIAVPHQPHISKHPLPTVHKTRSSSSLHKSQVTTAPHAHGLGVKRDIACPEILGGIPFYCSDEWCGGEDPNNKGHCSKANALNSHCQCTTASRSDSVSLTTVTVNVDGKNNTAVYAIQTLDEYKSLRKQKTIETLVDLTPATTTDANAAADALETVVGVIAAGGVLWVLAEGWLAGAETAAGEIGINEAPTDEGDDATCPDPNLKCPSEDCLGHTLGLCTVANEYVNCPCDECPPVEELFCEEEWCGAGWKENTCTVESPVEGCPCTWPPCPVERVPLDNGKVELRPNPEFCSDCGNSIGTTYPQTVQCKGIDVGLGTDKLGYEGCSCKPEEKPAKEGSRYNLALDDLFKLGQEMHDKHTNFSADSWGLDTTLKLPNSFCPTNSPGVQKADVATAIDDFCAAHFQKDIMKDGRQSQLLLVPSPQDEYPERRIPTWLSVSTWTSPPATHNCSSESLEGNYTLFEAECKEAFSYANLNCTAFKKPFTQGGSMPGYCLAYEIFTNSTYDSASPPWLNPVPEQNRPDCGDDQTAGNKDVALSNVETSFWAGMYTKFCNAIADHSDGQPMNYTQEDWETNRNVPPGDHPIVGGLPLNKPLPKYGNDWQFRFNVNASTGCKPDDCLAAYNILQVSSCGVQSTSYNQIAPAGSVIPEFFLLNTTCSLNTPRFNYMITPPLTYDSSCSLQNTDYPPDRNIQPMTFSAADLEQYNVIRTFCDDLVIPHPLPDRSDPLFPAKEVTIGSGRWDKLVRVEAVFAGNRLGGYEGLDAGCVNLGSPEGGKQWGGSGSMCREILDAAVGKCNGGDSEEQISGAWSMEHEDPRGCVV